eukprot:CAMPEP_0203916956 /NCGR_PEP_ID=MMETSP0359-20131031/57608_1 /ASSEMBLY_ACC=CAM_ASM_000338 /TAXON_ID=268821 /ORGANISM="Scrippsiella Hangoei, Strain SHTV-5" /LENGTH=205 /DNA_ID=CAMNT_0050843741 /DNA_START=212 /DNA_END=825 /DNA_ORIENTATION=-
MKGAVTEGRFQTLRNRLNDLHYKEALSRESSSLVENLLMDLLSSVETLQELKEGTGQQGQRLDVVLSEVAALRHDNSRLLTDNNTLHSELLDASESMDRLEVDMRSQLRALEAEIDHAGAALGASAVAARRREGELHALREAALRALRGDTPVAGGGGGGGPGAAAAAAAAALRGPAAVGGPPPAVAANLGSQLAALSEASAACA